MRINRLGRSAVEVTELALGGGPLGGLFTAVDDAAAAETLAAAWDCGIRFFDTSPHYGLGVSEHRMGAFLRGRPRAGFTLSTKAGRLLVPQDPAGRTDERFAVPATHRRVWDFTRDGILRSLEDSLARMGTDRVDVLLLHDAEERFEDALRDGWPALAELRAQGVVGAVGAGMHDSAKLTRLVREADVDVVMLSGRFTLLDRSALVDLLPSCVRRGVSVLAASVFNSGLLASPRPAEGAMFDYAPAPPELLRRAQRIADVCATHAVPLPQAAMAYPLLHPAVAGIVVGMRSAAEVRSDVEMFEAGVPAGLWTDLREAGLLDEPAPGAG